MPARACKLDSPPARLRRLGQDCAAAGLHWEYFAGKTPTFRRDPAVSTAASLLLILARMIRAIIVGLMAGWLAGKLMRGRGYGVLADVALGLVGGLVGGIIFAMVGFHAYNSVGVLAVSTVGALLLVTATRVVRGEL